jgi:hypothetical protein
MNIIPIIRNERGSLTLNRADLDIIIGQIIDICRTEKELEWVQDQLIGCIESMVEGKLEELEDTQP